MDEYDDYDGDDGNDALYEDWSDRAREGAQLASKDLDDEHAWWSWASHGARLFRHPDEVLWIFAYPRASLVTLTMMPARAPGYSTAELPGWVRSILTWETDKQFATILDSYAKLGWTAQRTETTR